MRARRVQIARSCARRVSCRRSDRHRGCVHSTTSLSTSPIDLHATRGRSPSSGTSRWSQKGCTRLSGSRLSAIVVATLPPVAFARAAGVPLPAIPVPGRGQPDWPRGRRACARKVELGSRCSACGSGRVGCASTQRTARRVGQPVASSRCAVHERPADGRSAVESGHAQSPANGTSRRAGFANTRVLLLNGFTRQHAQLEQHRIWNSPPTLALSPTVTGDAGLPHGAELVAFADRGGWCRRSSAGHGSPSALVACAGEAFMIDAAAVVANFEMMTRVADGTGARFPEAGADHRAAISDKLTHQ